MKLYIGGKAQGKCSAALQVCCLAAADVCDGGQIQLEQLPEQPILNHLHRLIRRLLESGSDPMKYAQDLLVNRPELVVICDEVGCGVVPVESAEREWREAVGRVCCFLAQNSSQVIRVIAGIPVVIKGE